MKTGRLLITIGILLLMPGVSLSQTISWSKPLADDKKFPFLKILGETEDGYCLLRSNMTFRNDKSRSGFRTRRYLIQSIDEDLRTLRSNPLSAGCDDCHIADVGIVGSHIVMLYSEFDKPARRLRFFITRIDPSGSHSGDRVLLLETGAEKFDEENQPDLIFSQNGNLFACAIRLVRKDEPEQVYATAIFDTSLNVIARKEIPVRVDPKLFGPITSVLTNEGNFYLLGIEFLTEKRVKNPGESFYRLLSYQFKNDAVSQKEIKLENKFLTDVAISADNLNRKIVVSGFYSEKTAYSIAGVFYYSFSEDSATETSVVTSTFSSEFIRKTLTEGRTRDNELVNFSIDRSVLRKDGGAALVAESFYISSRSYWDYYLQMWVYHYYYHYGNIIALSVNPDGTVLWSNSIQKDQNSTDDGGYYSSYFSCIIDGEILNIYNKYISDKTSVLMTSINGLGEQRTTALFEESNNVLVIPHSAKQVDESTVLMPVERDGDPYLVKLMFE